MLGQGYHKSFREIDIILKLQIADRHRLGSEHPVWDRPLLENENTKLEYLGKKLNKAETAERNGKYCYNWVYGENIKLKCMIVNQDDYQTVYKNYHDIASYFLIQDDTWLSDYFYGKCLKITQSHSNTDKMKLAEAFCNMGLACERQSKLLKVIF